MKPTAARLDRSAWLALLLIPLAMVAGRADAQVNPAWDHYKVYIVSLYQPPPPSISVILRDQFGQRNHSVNFLNYFMNPTTKETPPPLPGFSGITNPDLHYSWWQLTPDGFNGIVTATNQFGDQTLNVHDGVWLLNPALKNQPGGPPIANHYKCYDCDGQSIQRPVLLTDQFGPFNTTVFFPRFFCNPVEKQIPGQQPNPIVDPNQHYICYTLSPQDLASHTATMTDQFLANHTMDFSSGIMLCVPTYKLSVTAAIKDTWGRVKLLYR